MKTYDYLIVGAGLFGSVFAYEASKYGKTCLVVEKRAQVGGNLFCQNRDGIDVHTYGAHIFHTDKLEIWDYVRAAAPFRQYAHAVMANHEGKLFNLPFNMNTFYQIWGLSRPEEVAKKLNQVANPEAAAAARNLEERALALVGPDVYELLIKHYTEKQWGRPCSELPAFIISRLPLRMSFDNNYFNDPYQGMPKNSYNQLFETWLAKADVRLNTDFLLHRAELSQLADRIIYTGALDAYFNFCYGELAFRSLRFEQKRVESANFQGCPVMNYTDAKTPYTRILEHKHFKRPHMDALPYSIITFEYAQQWTPGQEAYYPLNDARNTALYARYRARASAEKQAFFGGRLADYRYYDMDDTVEQALLLAKKLLR